MNPQDLKYTETHEWIKWDGKTATVGITDHAQQQLTDIVYVELPDAGVHYTIGAECAVIESCKIAAELYAPLTGKILAVNEDLRSNPGWINEEPYGKGWILQMEVDNPSELDRLLDVAGYEDFVG